MQIAAELKAQQERLQALDIEDRDLTDKIADWRGRHPELDDGGLEDLLRVDDTHVSELRQRLQNSEKAIEQAKVLLQERDQRLLAHQAQHNGNLDAEQLASSAGRTAKPVQRQRTALRRIARRAGRRSAPAKRQPGPGADRSPMLMPNSSAGRVSNALIGSATGDTFRKIAQAYNLDLLVHHANVQLRQLVRRYRLKRGGSMLGLLVMDTEMGDELRSVHSLSGGETFLVSLALALGLASMASSTLKIESLFIDEGFGSLDPESLQLAMDALDGLQAQGRKVAVISHVQEMHERIPVQIQVMRQGNGLSTLEVK